MSNEGWVIVGVGAVIIAAATGHRWLILYAALACAVATGRLLLSMT